MNFMIFGQNPAKPDWFDGLYLLRSRWPLVLLIASLVLLGGAALRSKRPPWHEATVRIALDPPGESARDRAGDPGFRPDRSGDLARQAAELSSRALLSEVLVSCGLAERWGFSEEEEGLRLLEARLRVESLPSRRFLVVAARDLAPEHAAALANAVAERFVARKEAEAMAEAHARVRRLERERQDCIGRVAAAEAHLAALGPEEDDASGEAGELRARLADQRHLLHSLEANRRTALREVKEAGPRARIESSAAAERAVAAIPPCLGLPALTLLGLVLGLAVSLGIRRGRMRWSTVADLMRRLDVPVVGFAPLSGESAVGAKESPESLLEPYRDLRNRLLRLPAADCVLLTVMPLRKDEPVAEAIANLGCVLADAGRATLVVDADFRRPRLHRFFDAAQHPGLSDFLSGEMRLEETVIRSRRPNLWFMPAGPLHADSGALLNGRRMADLVWELRRRFDTVLVASPSIHDVSDAGLLAGLADYTLAATSYLGHSLRGLRETKAALETVSAPFGGVVLTVRARTEVADGDGGEEDVPVEFVGSER